MTPVLEELKVDYGDDLRFVFRHMPLISIHDNAQITAEATEAAGAQGLFWEMHDLLFERQNEWSGQSEDEILETLVSYAAEIGVSDVEQFQQDLEEDTYAEVVMTQYQEALDAGISSTPSFVVNQVNYPAQDFGLSYRGLDIFIQLMELRTIWFDQPEQVIEADKEYVATIETEKGDIVIELFAETAPVNVNSFAFLAQEDWYQGVTFHRVLPEFVAQAGDPTGTGIGFPGYRCGDEVTPVHTFDQAGMVSLANSGPNTNGSQFFITFDALPQLNPNFTIIGQVIEGLDVAESLTPRDPQENPQAPPGDAIIDITIAEKS